MWDVLTRLERLASTEIALTLFGETGTGKNLLARAVHDASQRADGPFVTFDCGAVPAERVGAELFGEIAPDAPASEPRAGAIERAHAGTLFLEEVGELSLSMQARLLRFLETGSVSDAGVERPVSLRVIAATSRDLRLRVTDGAFREDLYFRLSAALVTIPPLRARLDDLPLIVPELLAKLGRQDVRVAEEVYVALAAQSWPGNVRQLKNVLEYALLDVEAGLLEARHLNLSMIDPSCSDLDHLPLGGLPLAEIERAAIKQTLALMGGMKARAAQSLGIAVSTLYDKVKKYGL
jgi:DNA-binding NtrC family response regulator